MRERHVIVGRALAGLVFAGLALTNGPVACGGSPPPPQVVAPLPAETSSMTFFFRPSAMPKVNAAVQQALVAAGYRLAVAEKAPNDAELKLDASTAPERSFVQTVVNGVPQVKERISVSIAVVAQGRIVDQPSAQFVVVNGAITDVDVQPLITAMTSSAKMGAFARDRKALGEAAIRQRAVEEERRQREKADAEEEARKKAESEAETAWQAAKATDCSTAASTTACDALVEWKKKNETGPHVEEACAILKEADPKVRLLRDTAAWREAHVDTCKAPKGANDCGGVEKYLMVFGNDEHSKEARDLLAASSKRIAAFKADDDRRQAAEEKRAEQREQADARREVQQQKAQESKACRDNCTSKDGFCGVHRDRQKFQDCSVKCIQRRCN